MTDEVLSVGISRLRNVDTLAPGLQPAQAEHGEYYDALIDHVNRTGGIACRRVDVVWHDRDALDESVFLATMEQQMCADWTQDHEVFAAVPSGFNGPFDILYPCLDRAGVAIIDVRGVTMRDGQDFDEVPHLVAVNGVRLDRATAAQVHALVRQGFLTAQNRIGVVQYDAPRFDRTVEQVLVPALASHGLSLAGRRSVALPTSSRQNPDRSQAAASAALRFKFDGIDRVLFLRGAALAADFMHAAEYNDYHPRYGLTTDDLPWVERQPPASQLRGARGIGWLPDADRYPRRPGAWAARSSCLEFFGERGFSTATMLDQLFALQACEAVWFLRAAVGAAPQPLSGRGVVVGASRLGTTYESPLVRWTSFGPQRRDGAAIYRDMAYSESCGCFDYVEGPRPLG